MAFASPDVHSVFGRWPVISGSVRDAVARLDAVWPMLSQAATRFMASAIAAVRVSERQAVAAPRAVHATRAAPRQMTLADQWTKVSAVLVRSVDGSRAATEMQSAATQQLDLAQYGLTTLVDELSAVMALPGRRSRIATVHAFGSRLDASDAVLGHGHALAA